MHYTPIRRAEEDESVMMVFSIRKIRNKNI